MITDNSELIKEVSNKLSEPDFIKELNSFGCKIENELNSFLESKCCETKVYNKIERRVKSSESFHEKIVRKNYVDKWNLRECRDVEYNTTICENLEDLLGFRITCYFKEDEIIIYEQCKGYFKSLEESTDEFTFNFDTNTVMENKEIIYKFTGKYSESGKTVCFEVQIKSLINNLWGEVEHKSFYKSEDFYPESFSNLRKSVVDQVNKTLDASDRQMKKLYDMNYNEADVEKLQFYLSTKDKVIENVKHKKLEKHYKIFYHIFYDKLRENLQVYVLNKQLSKIDGSIDLLPYNPLDFSSIEEFSERVNNSNKLKECMKIINEEFFHIHTVYTIFKELIEEIEIEGDGVLTFDKFKVYIIWFLYERNQVPVVIEEDINSTGSDSFGEEDDFYDEASGSISEQNDLDATVGAMIKNDLCDVFPKYKKVKEGEKNND